MPAVPGGASKCFRYTHVRSQADGSQFRQDKGVTVCGKVTASRALSSNPGRLPADPGEAPKSHPVPNENVVIL
jgi:hypothetical protein